MNHLTPVNSLLLFLCFSTVVSSTLIVDPQCLISGCSGQLCGLASEGPKLSTCEWRAEYACYRPSRGVTRCVYNSTDNTCGWEQTDALKQCLAKPSSGGFVQTPGEPQSDFVENGCDTTGCENQICVKKGEIIYNIWCPPNDMKAKCYSPAKKLTKCVINPQNQCEWQQTPQLQQCLDASTNSRSQSSTGISQSQLSSTATHSDSFVNGPCKLAGCSQTECIYRTFLPPVTTCEFKPEYECYQQSKNLTTCGFFDGKCQWDQTPELQKCLANANQSNSQSPLAQQNLDSSSSSSGIKFPNFVSGQCKVFGCSQCVDQNFLGPPITKCDYNPEYSCYEESKHLTTCGFFDGKCQWDQTPELQKCILNVSPPNPVPQKNSTFVDPQCRIDGCSSQLCVISSTVPTVTTCKRLDIYECFRAENKLTKCTYDSKTNKCGWAQTVELGQCLASKNVRNNQAQIFLNTSLLTSSGGLNNLRSTGIQDSSIAAESNVVKGAAENSTAGTNVALSILAIVGFIVLLL